MGGRSKSKTVETTLSKEQARILKVHEAQYQSVLFPALRSMIQRNSDINSVQMSPWLVAQQDKVTKAFGQAQTAVGQGLAQRGIAEGGVGSLIRGRVAQAGAVDRINLLQQAVGQEQDSRMKAMDLFSRHSPGPTTAAPMGTRSKGPSTMSQIAVAAAGGFASSAGP